MIATRTSISKEHAHCRACGDTASRRIAQFGDEAAVFRCSTCGASFAVYDDRPERNDADHFEGIDLDSYSKSVKATRERSYHELARRVGQHVAQGAWLDVGCSYGWMLQHMRQRGYTSIGVEPSPAAANHARSQGLTIHEGLFPDAVPAESRFQVISFMDVLEHLPSPRQALNSTRELLADDGVLVIQVPDQACFLYRLAETMHRGTGGRLSFALRRLWLLDFDFPHQTYFTQRSLAQLLGRAGWSPKIWWRSAIGGVGEAAARVSYAKQSGLSSLANQVVAAGVAGIQLADSACGHGGLLSVIARPRGVAT